MALALYRKYRPRTFAEIIGQEHVTEPLSQALRTGRLHHAYLFSGPRGCGKTSSARILARSLNCVKGPTPEPCGECESCRALAPDGAGSIDVIEIDAASHGGVDDARDLRERAFFAPVSSRYKVYVIDEAHMVSSAGFNALLKLVEEPPEYVKFVFATTEPEKVLGTIKSRTHHYPFRLIPPGVLRPYLERLCEAEGVQVEPNVFPLVVRAGGGSGRDSLSILDQLIAGAGDEGVTYARAVALLGVTDVTLIDEMCDALVAGDGAAVFATIDRVAEAGHDPRRFAGDLLARLRDLIVMQQVPDAVGKGLLDGAGDELSRMEAQARQFGPATLSRMADVVHGGLIDMRGTTSPRLVLELIAARMLLPDAEGSTGALLQRLERMERRLAAAGDAPIAAAPVAGAPTGATPAVVSPAAPPAGASSAATPPVASPASGGLRQPARSEPPAQAEPVSSRPASQAAATEPAPARPAGTATESGPGAAPAPRLGALDAAAVRRQWDMVLSQVRRANPRVGAMAREAVVRDVEGDTLVLLFEHQFHATSLSSDPKLLLQALTEVFGGQWQVRCELSGQQSKVVPVSAPPARPAVDRQPLPADEPDWPEAAPIGGALPDAAPLDAASTPSGNARRPRGGANNDNASSGGGGAAGPPAAKPSPARRSAGAKTASQTASKPASARTAASAASAPISAGSAVRPAAGGGSGVPEMGFDDGDEPLDDDVEPATRQSSQDQAISLLRQTLGAETISDLDSR